MPRLESHNFLPSIREFFDALSLLGKASMEYALYALNGTTLVWVLLLLARFSDGIVASVDAENIKRNICKVTELCWPRRRPSWCSFERRWRKASAIPSRQ